MHVHVRLAEPFWRAVGQRNLDMEIREKATIADLMTLLRKRYPALSQELAEAPPYIFVGEDEADAKTLLSAGCRVHLLWAVAGG